MSEVPSHDFTPAPEIPANNPYAGLSHPEYDNSIPEKDAMIARAEQLRQSDAEFARIFQEECLIFLLTADREWFLNQYTGERDADGYLVDKDGNPTSFLPSQNITAGLDRVSKVALEKYEARKQ